MAHTVTQKGKPRAGPQGAPDPRPEEKGRGVYWLYEYNTPYDIKPDVEGWAVLSLSASSEAGSGTRCCLFRDTKRKPNPLRNVRWEGSSDLRLGHCSVEKHLFPIKWFFGTFIFLPTVVKETIMSNTLHFVNHLCLHNCRGFQTFPFF